AFICTRGEVQRVCVTSRTGEAAADVAATEPTGHGQTVAWLSDDLLLAQLPNHRDFARIDVRAHAERAPLLGPLARLGWAFSPVVSHDRKRVAFYWNREDLGRAIWIINADGTEPKRIHAQPYTFPIAWSKDDRWIYAFVSGEFGSLHELLVLDAAGR